jgi:hypothetical protein
MEHFTKNKKKTPGLKTFRRRKKLFSLCFFYTIMDFERKFKYFGSKWLNKKLNIFYLK